MILMERMAAMVVLSCGLSASVLLAGAPEMINYQGRLTDDGALVNRSVSMKLRLYNAPTGGTMVYEDSNTVMVVDGLYSTAMGDGTTYGSLCDALTNDAVYVEVVVDGVILSPRERLLSAAYALQGGSLTSFAPLLAGDNTFTGPTNRFENVLVTSNLTVNGTFSLATPAYDDVVTPLLTAKTPSGSPAVVKQVTAITGSIYQLAFESGKGQDATFSIQLPHGYKRGTDLYPHLHFICSSASGGDVVFGLEYVTGSLTGVYSSVSTTRYFTNAATSRTSMRMEIHGWDPISGVNLRESSCLFGRIFRPNVAGDTYPDDVFGISLDVHYQVRSLGSRNPISDD